MATALILAGGVGERMAHDIPKQFIHVFDKPIIIYTLEAFQSHPSIERILVACLEGWEDVMWGYAKQYGIEKLKWLVPGGRTSQESVRNGVFALEKHCAPEDIVVIHDGNRPLVEAAVLSDVIIKCRQLGNAVSSLPYVDQMFTTTDGITTSHYIPRETLRKVSTPQAYPHGKLLEVYRRAYSDGTGIHFSAYTNTIMVDMGETLHFAAGSEKNIKLTTPEDIDIFKALLKTEAP